MFTVFSSWHKWTERGKFTSGRTAGGPIEVQAVLKITPGAIWECSTAGKGKAAGKSSQQGPKITWGATGTATTVWIKEGLCSRESFAPSVCVGCVIQGVPKAGSAAHPTTAQREREEEQLSVPTTAPHRERSQERWTKRFSHPLMENLPPPPSAWGWKSRWGNWSMILTAGHDTSSHGKQLRKSKASY